MKTCFECGETAAHDHHVIPRSPRMTLCLRYEDGRLREVVGWDPDRVAVVYERSTAEVTERVYVPHRIRWGAPKQCQRELVLFLTTGVDVDASHLADVERWVALRGGAK